MNTRSPTPQIIQSLDTLLSLPGMSGVDGINRSKDTPFIPVTSDIEAIDSWLAKSTDRSEHTYHAYFREAERLVRWAIIAKHKPLSSLDLNDIIDYRAFLLNPEPVELWIGKKHAKNHPDWRPFTGPLSSRSAKHADNILFGLFAFLVEQRYLIQNPYSSLHKLADTRRQGEIAVNRSLTAQQWAFVTQLLRDKVASSRGSAYIKWVRTELIILLLYITGLRIHEIAKAALGDILRVERRGEIQYWLKVIGKGLKYREVPIPLKTYAMINAAHLQITGTSIDDADVESPIIPPIKTKTATNGVHFLTRHAIHKILKAFFQIVSNELLASDPDGAKKLAQASTHWLRHTHGTHAIDANIPVTIVRDNLGHSSITTTSQYIHAAQNEQHKAMSDFAELK